MLPAGEVTMLFSDIEGSTRLLEALGDAYGDVLQQHRTVLRRAWAIHKGVEVSTDGDSFFVAFTTPRDALNAAVEGQRGLRERDWPDGRSVRVRMGIHTGHPRIDEDDYWGADVHLAARVAAAAHGGQVLLTAPTAAGLSNAPLEDLGEWRLKDFDAPVRLLQAVIDGEGADLFPPPRALDVRASNLPRPATPLVGREGELEQLKRLLSGGVSRLVTIVGVGGAGKTRLALEVGHALLEHFPDGVFFVDLSGVGDATAIPRVVASVLGVAPDEQAMLDYVRDRRLLLVVDNCEHVLEGVGVIAGWMAGAAGLRVLATSQAPLRLRGERCLPLDSLELPTGHGAALEQLGQVPSVRLFVDRARDGDPRFVLSAANAAAVVDICRRLEGMPMAIELAAARCRLLGPQQLARRLQEDLLALGGAARDVPARQRSLRAAMEWTTGLLGGDERMLFARWGVFRGRPTLERADAVCGLDLDVFAAAEALVDHSLLRRDPDERLRMPQSVHAYARRLLEDSDDMKALARRHATVMADVADWHYAAFMLDTEAVLTDAAAHRDDLFAALRWAAGNDPGVHARLAAGMVLPLLLSGALLALGPDVEHALARETEPRTRIRLRVAEGVIAYARGDREQERRSFEQALDQARQTGHDEECALVLAIFAKVIATGDQPSIDPCELLEEARRLAPAVTLDGFDDLLDGLTGESYLYLAEGRVNEAADLIIRAARGGGARHYVAWGIAYYMPDLDVARGNYHSALQGYVRQARFARARGHENDLIWHLEYIGACLVALGRPAEGVALVAAGQARSAAIGTPGRPRDLQRLVETQMSVARQALGEAEADEAVERGRRMPWDGAVGLGLRAATIGTSGAPISSTT